MMRGLKDLFRDGGWCWQSRDTFQSEKMSDLWQDLCEDDPNLPRTISIPQCSTSSDECSDMYISTAMGEDDDDSVIGIMLPIPEEDEDLPTDDFSVLQNLSVSCGSAGFGGADDDDELDSIFGDLMPETISRPVSLSSSRALGATSSNSQRGRLYEPGRSLATKLLQNRSPLSKPTVATTTKSTLAASSRLPPKPNSGFHRTTEKTPLRSNQSSERSRTRADSLVYSVDDDEEDDDDQCLYSSDDCWDDFDEPRRLGALPNTSLAYTSGGSVETSPDGFPIQDFDWSLKQDARLHRKTTSSLTEDTCSVTSMTSSCQSV